MAIMMKKKQFGFYKTMVILFVGLNVIGFSIYNSLYMIAADNYIYETEISEIVNPIDREVTLSLTLPGDHHYHILISVIGQTNSRCVFNFDFETLPDFSEEISVTGITSWSRDDRTRDIFLSPFEVEVDEKLTILVDIYPKADDPGPQVSTNFAIQLYQDMPKAILISFVWIIPPAFLVILLWKCAYDKYEAPFNTEKALKVQEEAESEYIKQHIR